VPALAKLGRDAAHELVDLVIRPPGMGRHVTDPERAGAGHGVRIDASAASPRGPARPAALEER
jgi:hypothetical protein